MPSAVVEFIQGEPRARRALWFRSKGETWSHAFLKAQQWAHENEVTVAHLRLAYEVVVTYGDSGKGHVGSRLLIQHGDAVVLEVVYDSVSYLQQKCGQGDEEDQSPQTLTNPELLVLHKHMVGPVEGAAAEEGGQVIHLSNILLVFCVPLTAPIQAVKRVTIPVAFLHPLVVVVENVFAVSSPVVVVGGKGDGAHDPDWHGGGAVRSRLGKEDNLERIQDPVDSPRKEKCFKILLQSNNLKTTDCLWSALVSPGQSNPHNLF